MLRAGRLSLALAIRLSPELPATNVNIRIGVRLIGPPKEQIHSNQLPLPQFHSTPFDPMRHARNGENHFTFVPQRRSPARYGSVCPHRSRTTRFVTRQH